MLLGLQEVCKGLKTFDLVNLKASLGRTLSQGLLWANKPLIVTCYQRENKICWDVLRA